jgi:hypothetical protein
MGGCLVGWLIGWLGSPRARNFSWFPGLSRLAGPRPAGSPASRGGGVLHLKGEQYGKKKDP